jgi:hypothetical protein
MADLRDILSNEEENLDEQELKKYVQGHLPNDEQHNVEKIAADSPFMTDALEGLEQIKNNEKLDEYVKQLNKNLQQQLNTFKQRKEKRKLKDNPWIVIAFILIIGLCVLAYFIINLQRQQ